MRFTLVIMLLSISIITAQSSVGDTAQFYFIQISDTHWGDGNHLELTRKAVQMIKKLPVKIEFIAHTGDLMARTVLDSNYLDSGLAVLKSAGIPLHFVAGNHDLDPNNPLTFSTFKARVGKFNTIARCQGVNLIFACTEPLAGDFSIPEYSPISELNVALGRLKGKPCLLFVHTVPCPDFYDNSFHNNWPQSNKNSFEKVIETNPPLAIIAGHFHRSDFHWIKNCPVYICPPIAGYFGREASFRLYKYRYGKLEIISQYVH